MNPWHFHILLFISIFLGTALYTWKSSQGHFDAISDRKKTFARFLYTFCFMVMLGIPYATWSATGFSQSEADELAMEIERDMLAQEGVAAADATFIVTSRSEMKGNVDVTNLDGTSETVRCTAIMGQSGRVLTDCQ